MWSCLSALEDVFVPFFWDNKTVVLADIFDSRDFITKAQPIIDENDLEVVGVGVLSSSHVGVKMATVKDSIIMRLRYRGKAMSPEECQLE